MTNSNEINAVTFTENIKNTYIRYLYTTNIISDDEDKLKQTFYEKLNKDYSVIQGPFFHCTPCYEPSLSIDELVKGHSLSSKILKLPREHFDPSRPLYTHQVESIDKLQQGKNLVVATGTGSGKTECFLLPILNNILANPSPGLRAIIIYPMNALADDQLFRFRKLLRDLPDVTFGRYTGDTPYDAPEDIGEEILKNERMTRSEIRKNPPHILLTNFAMLEYLLLRPNDSAIFANQNLSYIVLDEAHSYTGSQGIEIALLMRRVKQYLLRKESSLQFILTSATLGDEEDSIEKVASFASDLTGSSFESNDVLQGAKVDSFRKELIDYFTLEEIGKAVQNTGDISGWNEVLDDPEKLLKKMKEAGFKTEISHSNTTQEMLYELLSSSAHLAKIHDLCRETPATETKLCEELNVEENDLVKIGIVWLVTMGTHARKTPDVAPLLPMRFHFFTRGLAGATICMNPECSSLENDSNEAWSRFILEDINNCPDCEKKVLPISTCVHCGLPAHKIFLKGNKWNKTPEPFEDEQPALILTWCRDLGEEAFEKEQEDESEEHKEQFAYLCLSCGEYKNIPFTEDCCENSNICKLHIVTEGVSNGLLKKCPRCGGASGSFDSVLRDFTTAEDAPTAVLAESIIRNLPIPKDQDRNVLPANGRNLLVFSDSRQRAAFFAPYLSQTTAESAYQGPLLAAIRSAENLEGEPVSFDDISNAYWRLVESQPVAVIRNKDSGEDFFELIPKKKIRKKHKRAIQKEVELALYKNFCSSKKQKQTIEGVGLATVELDFNEHDLECLKNNIPEIFDVSEIFGKQLIMALVSIFLERKSVKFPDYITAKDLSRLDVGPDVFTFHRNLSGNIEKRLRYRWNPYGAPKRSRSNAIRLSRQLTLLCKILHKDKKKDETYLHDLLENVWDCLIDGVLSETNWGGEYRLDPDCLQITQHDINWFICPLCGHITSLGALGCCLNGECLGIPVEISPSELDDRFKKDHYRNRYMLPSLPLEVREHTAQLTAETGKRYQREFIKGEVNVLSSSTTFEMGIDVGNLKSVLLRNVPPTTSSYIQRAGRAGRRHDGISASFTYCRNIPHDQFNYQHPEAIIKGIVPAPFINVENTELAQRHCNSLLLGEFFRDITNSGLIDLKDNTTVFEFFLEEYSGDTLAAKFKNWCCDTSVKKRLIAILDKVIPAEIIKQLSPPAAIDTSIDMLIRDEKSVLQQDVQLILSRFSDQINDLEKQLTEATGKERFGMLSGIESLKKLKSQLEQQRLINFLSSASWLPGYAFPQDNVKLLVRHPDYSSKMRLERDREIGISEYAPGAEIVADGKVFTSGGVWYNSKEPEIRWYVRCPECRKIQTGLDTERPPFDCSACGTALNGYYASRRYLKPDAFTTLVGDVPTFPNLFRKRPPRASEVFLLEGTRDFKEHKIQGISYGVKKDGKLFRANSNHGLTGFDICQKCGKNTKSRPHENPWGGSCRGRFITLDMAHEIVTDILQLRFHQCSVPPPDTSDGVFWQSFLAAFLNGVSDALGISINDIGGTYHGWTEESFVGELVIYDRIPGGAGYIGKIIDELDVVLDKVLSRVRDCKCSDEESSCYACLRSYSNQFYWENLSRRPVIDWLTKILV